MKQITAEQRAELINRDIFHKGDWATYAEWTHWPKWLYDLAQAGLQFHLDDDPFDINEIGGTRTFTDAEAAEIKKRVSHIFAHACDPWEFFPMPDDIGRFHAARTRMDVPDYLEMMGLESVEELTGEHPDDPPQSKTIAVWAYDSAYITERDDGKFVLILERSEWVADALGDLEGYLFNWWKDERDNQSNKKTPCTT